MTSAYIGAGLALGAQAVGEYSRGRPERDARRAEAKTKQEQAELSLQSQRDMAPIKQSAAEIQLEKQAMQLRGMQGQVLKSNTFDAFRRYEGDGDIKHLNNFLVEAKKNPMGQKEYGGVLRLDVLTRTSETEALLRKEGIVDLDTLFAEPEQLQDVVLATNVDGSLEVVNMLDLYATTGYAKNAEKERLATMSQKAALQQTLRGSQSAETNLIAKIAEEDGISTYEATKQVFALKNAGKVMGSKVERVADSIMAENPTISRLDAIKQATQTTEQRTAGMKDVDASDAIRAELDEAGFFEADLSDPKNRRLFGPKISAIEKLADTKLTTEDKRTVRNLRSLTELGGVAGKNITDEEAGFIDRLLLDTKQYISNEIKGTEGSAAYETFRNVFRNALYGASLTATEVSAFNKAAGNLKQQTGPVLQKLLVQVQDVKSQLESVYLMNDEHVATYYMGKSLEEVDQVIEALDERVSFFKSMTTESTTKIPTAAKPKRSLEEIFQ